MAARPLQLHGCAPAGRSARPDRARPGQKIFDSSLAAIGMLYAKSHDVFRKYNDLVFYLFWKRALDIENREAIRTVLSDASTGRGLL